MNLPAGYAETKVNDALIIADVRDTPFIVNALRAAGSLHDFAARTPDARPLAGRGVAYAITAGDAQWVVRHYRRGGAIASLLVDRYARGDTPRPVHELMVSSAARARGIATPRVTAAVVYNGPFFYRGDIATERVQNAHDLAELTLGDQPWVESERVEAWRAAGNLLRHCFDNGLVHADLNLKNILAQKTATGIRAHVIDLDRARMESATSQAERSAMLERFHRSRRKIEHASGNSVHADALRAFDEGLTQ